MANITKRRPGVDRSIDIAGERYGRLTVVERAGTSKHRAALWRCRCDCGQIRILPANAMRNGNTASCGCLHRDVSSTHRLSRTPIHCIWTLMMARCYNPSSNRFKSHGARGITVCERWHDIRAFLADMGEPPAGMSIEREDNDGNYEPGNCVWATPKQQARNRRSTLLVEYRGDTKSLAEWCEQLDLAYGTVWYRIKRSGQTPDQAFH